MTFAFPFLRCIKASVSLRQMLAVSGMIAMLPLNSGAAVAVGAKVTFYATAEGTPAPTFQWKRNGTDIPGATGAALVISAVSIADAGAYRVTASNVAGSADSADEILEVEGAPNPTIVAPSFTLQPVATLNVTTGESATLSVSASGIPTPAYQWQRNGVAIAGATSSNLTIANVTSNDTGTYAAVATNSGGSLTSSAAFVSVTEPVVANPPPPVTGVAPVITTQPVASQTVTAGATVTIAVAATGTPLPTYQWEKDGVEITGATASTLSLSTVTTHDGATYSVVVANSSGTVTSSPSVLVVTAQGVNPPLVVDVPPSIMSQPTPNQNVESGGTAVIAVIATGTPTPTYQWQKNGVNIAGATTSALTLAGVTAADSATYTVVTANSSGTVISSPSVLTVGTPVVLPPLPPADVAPVITTQPTSSQTAASGGIVTLTVAATGTPMPTYQWQRNDVAVPGATNANLVLTGVASVDSGSYVVVVSNAAGTVNSTAAVVTVSSPVVTSLPPATPPPSSPPASSGASSPIAPAITIQPLTSQSVLAGAEVTLSVTASGNPAPSFQWRKNGISILGATGATLVLRNTTAVDAATYSVLATNSVGSVLSANAVLAVGVKPVFSTQPESHAINLGARVMLTAVAIAMPAPTLQWFKNGTAVTGATAATLVLSATTANDLAAYTVTATNSLGSVTSREATVVIAAPPIITSQPTSHTVAARSNVTFSVGATGSPTPTYQWKKNGVNIPGATSSKLTLISVGTSDAGAYSVEAINSVGWVPSSRATLNVSAAVEQRQTDTGGTPVSPGTVAATGGAISTGSRIVNLSVRSRAGSGDNGLIVGFVIGGGSSKPMLLRGVGPALGDFGVSDALSDPTLALYSGAVMTASNDDWAKDSDAAQIVGTSARLGAFSLPDASGDSAMMANLETGAYTVQVNGKSTATGVALVEVYDAAATNPASLVNLSVRTNVGTGADAPNVGFVVSGSAAKRVLIRAVGPTLAAFGVSDVLADPQLEIFRGGERLDANDNWGGDPALAATFARIGAFGLADQNSQDAVLLMTLQPGAYTVVASGVNGSTGIALVEVYDVP